MRNSWLSVGLLAVICVACASGPVITTRASPGVDFSKFRTYGFMQPLDSDRSNGVRTPLSKMLMEAMSQQMAARGIEPSDAPDLLVNFFVSTEARMEVRQVPTSTSFHGYRRGRYSTWSGHRTTVREVTQGTLSIDLVDADHNMLVWESAAEQRLRRDVRDISQDQIDEIVAQMMEEFMKVQD